MLTFDFLFLENKFCEQLDNFGTESPLDPGLKLYSESKETEFYMPQILMKCELETSSLSYSLLSSGFHSKYLQHCESLRCPYIKIREGMF